MTFQIWVNIYLQSMDQETVDKRSKLILVKFFLDT